MIQTRPARPSDLPAIEQLLQESGLPTAGVAEHLTGFVVVQEGDRVVASAGLEVYDRSALLRSVAVDPAYRNRGLAAGLVRGLLESGRGRGVAEVFLLTTTAADYFRRLGFTPIPRGDVPRTVQASREFKDGICETAQTMTLRLPRGSEGGRR